MKQVNLYVAKTNFSALVELAAAGEEIIIAKNGKPKARLVSLDAAPAISTTPILRSRRSFMTGRFSQTKTRDQPRPLRAG